MSLLEHPGGRPAAEVRKACRRRAALNENAIGPLRLVLAERIALRRREDFAVEKVAPRNFRVLMKILGMPLHFYEERIATPEAHEPQPDLQENKEKHRNEQHGGVKARAPPGRDRFGCANHVSRSKQRRLQEPHKIRRSCAPCTHGFQPCFLNRIKNDHAAQRWGGWSALCDAFLNLCELLVCKLQRSGFRILVQMLQTRRAGNGKHDG